MRRRRTTWRSAERISAIPFPARMHPSGIRATLRRSVQLSLTFRKFPGMIPAPACCSRNTWATSRLTARPACATTRSLARFSRPLSRAAAGLANARAELRRLTAWSAGLARAGRNLRGNRCWEIRAMVFAIRRTCRCSRRMACGATTTFSAGRTPHRAERRVAVIPARGPVRAERRLRRPSWRAFRRSSIRKRADRRAIPRLFIISLPRRSMVRAAAALAIRTTEPASARTARSTT